MLNRIRYWREKRGLTLEQVGDAIGASPQQIHKLERGERRLSDYWMERLAKEFGVRMADLLPEEAAPDAPPDAPPPATILADSLVGERDLPVYASAQGGPDGMITDFEVIEWVKRPAPLANVPKGFGIYVVGDSMEPVYEQGDMLLCHPSLPPRRDNDVLIVLRSQADNEHSCLVKRWVSGDSERVRLRQFNPPDNNITIARASITGIHVVVGRYNRR